MPYPEMMIHGMRQELAQLGIEETKTPEAVKAAVENTDGTVMVIVNSVCGKRLGLLSRRRRFKSAYRFSQTTTNYIKAKGFHKFALMKASLSNQRMI